MLHFTIPVHRHATTIHVASYGQPRPEAVLEFYPVTDTAVTPPAPASKAMLAEAAQLAAINDRASAEADARLDAWRDRMQHRLAMVAQRVKDMVVLHSRWEAFWIARDAQINAAVAARHGHALAAAYAAGGTVEVAGLVDQVRALIGQHASAHGLVASAGSAVAL